MRFFYFHFVLNIISISSLLTFNAYAQTIAITMDNPHTEETPLLSAQMRDQRIRETLNKNQLKIMLFVQGAQVDNPEGQQLLKNWNTDGHMLGNHTYSHFNLNTVEEKAFEADTLKNEKILKQFSQFKKLFRFPFLKEGNTVVKRDDFRKFLRENEYAFGSVTIDASDWYISARLEKRLKENPAADITAYKKYYLEHIWNRAQYYDNLAREVIGRSPHHTLLIHHNLLNALFLDDLIRMFNDKGWTWVSATEAFQDPIFKMTPNTLPAGEGLIWAMAKQSGQFEDQLHYPAEDGEYEKNAMDALGL